MHNTQNLADFGNVERDEAALLLTTLGSSKDDTRFFGYGGVAVEFNPISGYVFLVDEDCNVAMMNGDRLEDFLTCPNCNGVGVTSDFREDNEGSECCEEYADELNI